MDERIKFQATLYGVGMFTIQVAIFCIMSQLHHMAVAVGFTSDQ